MKDCHLLVLAICITALAACTVFPPPAQERPGGTIFDPTSESTVTGVEETSFTPVPATSAPPPPQPTLPLATAVEEPADTEAPDEPTATPEAIAFQPPGEQAFFEEELLRVSIMPTQEVGSGSGSTCTPDTAQIPRVQVSMNGMSDFPQKFSLWLIGFPAGEEIELSLVDPTGSKNPWTTIRVPDRLYDDTVSCQPATFLSLDGFLSLSMGSPDWRLSVDYPGGTYEKALIPWQQSRWWSGELALTHSPLLPGTFTMPLDPMLTRPYLPGETVYLQGVGFPPNSTVPLAMYHGSSPMTLMGTSAVESDENGAIATSFLLDSSFEQDTYSVIAAGMVPQGERYAMNLDAAAFQVLSGMPYQPCQGNMSSFLRTGDRAVVAGSEDRLLRLSPDTSESSAVTGEVKACEQLLLLRGPVCSFYDTDSIWWYVLDETSHQIGWTEESSEVEQWLTRSE